MRQPDPLQAIVFGIATGCDSISPTPFLGNVDIAAASLHNWALSLHTALQPKGVPVARMGITGLIEGGHPDAEPDVIAEALARLHDERRQPELHYVAYSG